MILKKKRQPPRCSARQVERCPDKPSKEYREWARTPVEYPFADDLLEAPIPGITPVSWRPRRYEGKELEKYLKLQALFSAPKIPDSSFDELPGNQGGGQQQLSLPEDIQPHRTVRLKSGSEKDSISSMQEPSYNVYTPPGISPIVGAGSVNQFASHANYCVRSLITVSS